MNKDRYQLRINVSLRRMVQDQHGHWYPPNVGELNLEESGELTLETFGQVAELMAKFDDMLKFIIANEAQPGPV